MNFPKFLLNCFGWKVECEVADYRKCIICVAPHTTNWDFILGKLAYASVGRHAGFLMKKSWFFFPLGLILKAMGGIPVERKHKTVSLTQVIIDKFNSTGHLVIAITPEGTRSRTSNWHTGFLNIAYKTNTPVVLAVIDGGEKTCRMTKVFIPTGDAERDMKLVKQYYSQFQAIYPERFTTD